MSSFITIMVAGIFTDNLITAKLLGVEEIYEKDTSVLSLIKKCGLISLLLFISNLVTYPIYTLALEPFGAQFLYPLVSVITVCGVLAAAFLLSKRFVPILYSFLKQYCGSLVCASAVLGLCLNSVASELVTGYLSSVAYSVASGVGFTLVSLIFYFIRERLDGVDMPDCVKGLPITLLIAAMLSMAFSGLAGI